MFMSARPEPSTPAQPPSCVPGARFGLDPHGAIVRLVCTEHAERSNWRPPAKFNDCHHPLLVDSLLQRVLDLVRDPVEEFEMEGRQVFLVAGLLVLERAEDGSLNGWLWHPVDGQLTLAQVQPTNLGVFPCPAGLHWLRAVVAAFEVELRRTVGGPQLPDDQVQPYLWSLFHALRRQLRRHADLSRMRRQVGHVLALDAATLALARQIHTELPLTDHEVSAARWNVAVRHREALQQLRRDLPQLLPLYGALLAHDELPPHAPRDALDQVRQHLARHGLRPATWRLICRSSVRLLLGVRETYRGRFDLAVINHLRIIQAMELREEPAPELIRAIWRRDGNPDYRWAEFDDQVGARAVLWGHVARSYARQKARTTGPGRAALHEAMLGVVGWVRDSGVHILDTLQRRAGWPWLQRQAEDWAVGQLSLAQDLPAWPAAEPFEVGSWRFVMLDSLHALREEGQKMHHCAASHADLCQAGCSAMFSIRDAVTGRRVATALYEPRGLEHWVLEQVHGPANTTAKPAIAAAARAAEQVVTAWMKQAPEPPLGVDVAALLTHDAVWFKVEGEATLSLEDHQAPETNAELFHLELADLACLDDVFSLGERHRELGWRFESTITDDLDSLRNERDEATLPPARRRRLNALMDAIEADPLAALRVWLTWRGEAGWNDLREVFARWLAEAPDRDDEAVYTHAGFSAEGAAYRWFSDLPANQREALGVVVVEGDCPGSSYFAAELRAEPAEANLAAARLGLSCRFRVSGEGA